MDDWLEGWMGGGWMGRYVIIVLCSQVSTVRRNLDDNSLIASFSLLSRGNGPGPHPISGGKFPEPSEGSSEDSWGGLMFSWVSLCATCLHSSSLSIHGQHPLSSLLSPRLHHPASAILFQHPNTFLDRSLLRQIFTEAFKIRKGGFTSVQNGEWRAVDYESPLFLKAPQPFFPPWLSH